MFLFPSHQPIIHLHAHTHTAPIEWFYMLRIQCESDGMEIWICFCVKPLANCTLFCSWIYKSRIHWAQRIAQSRGMRTIVKVKNCILYMYYISHYIRLYSNFSNRMRIYNVRCTVCSLFNLRRSHIHVSFFVVVVVVVVVCAVFVCLFRWWLIKPLEMLFSYASFRCNVYAVVNG